MEKRHGVELGQTYLNDNSCAGFVDTIAEIYDEELNQVCAFWHLDLVVVIGYYSNFYLHLVPPGSSYNKEPVDSKWDGGDFLLWKLQLEVRGRK